MFSEDKDTEFFYLPEKFCKFLMHNNKSLGNNIVVYSTLMSSLSLDVSLSALAPRL